jgi:anti-sigma regulatory factor (Ser/Thr protein kinase)
MVASEGTIRIRIASEADLTRALLETGRMVSEIGFEEAAASHISTAVSELGRNILKYAGSGELTLELVTEDHHSGVRAIVHDSGPGIEDLAQAMADHYSTSGTLGLGLPGVKRMMDEFHIDSAPGKGTRVVITKWLTTPASLAKKLARTSGKSPTVAATHPEQPIATTELPDREGAAGAIDWGTFNRPHPGERHSGDSAVIVERPDVIFMSIIDGLGHGPEAHQVATFAKDILQGSWTHDPVAVILRLHEELKGMRGAAAGVAVLNIASGEIAYVGVGNTVIRRVGPREMRLPSADGTLGLSVRTPVKRTMRLGMGDVLLLYTDGIRSSFKLDEYPQIQYESSATIARNVVERFSRSYDDATCIALRYKR